MMQYIEEFSRYVEITGYPALEFAKADAFLKTNRKQTVQSVAIQFFDAELVATAEHLYFAALNALQAFRGKTNISKNLAMETMLFASAQRQIQKAIDRIGIKPQSRNMAVLIIGETQQEIEKTLRELSAYLGAEPDESVLHLTPEKQKRIMGAFQISGKEIETVAKATVEEAVVALVVERMALLSTQL